jgi:redox-sensing transcriptional repressor
MKQVPFPTLQRLCTLFQILRTLKGQAQTYTSSQELASHCGTTAFSIRKDFATLGITGNSGQGYEIEKLMNLIGDSLGLLKRKKVCIVGLGKLGSALLEHPGFNNDEFEVVAGFDSNINKIETTKSAIPLFPFFQLSAVVSRLGIEYSLLAVPAQAAQDVTDKLVESGVKGIINFAPVMIKSVNKQFVIRNVDMTSELRILTAQHHINTVNSLHQ